MATYVERDVRQILNVSDLQAFQSFVRLYAGRVGQLVNLASLGSDCGITHNTARSWLSVLEASYVALRVPPWHANLGKRLVKTPKLYFVDTGLLCALLGIRTAGQVAEHPRRGSTGAFPPTFTSSAAGRGCRWTSSSTRGRPCSRPRSRPAARWLPPWRSVADIRW